MDDKKRLMSLEKYVSKKQIDKYLGCLIGGAIGDALGYPVEFMSLIKIKTKYGKAGIVQFELDKGVAKISDDTQLTLFTAAGYLLGTARAIYDCGGTGANFSYCRHTYEDWLVTQKKQYNLESVDSYFTWLMHLPELYHRRAPGLTCLSFGQGCSLESPTNDSKGCGGVMRVAPIGLIYPDFHELDLSEGAKVVLEGARCAGLTHGGELSSISAGCFAEIINLASHTDLDMEEIVSKALESTKSVFSNRKDFTYFSDLIHQAVSLADTRKKATTCIPELGEGWVAEEALAIAVFCAVRHQNNFEKGIIAAVNHDGDSDSTGAITGNILGAYLGLKAIPSKFLTHLELKDVIAEIGLDLAIGKNATRIFNKSIEQDPFYTKYVSRKPPSFIKGEKR